MKKINKLNKQFYRLICVFIFVIGLMTCCFTLAYFSSKDSVTNRVSGKDAEILLFEPAWFANGKQYADKLEPGEVIEKDPFIYNNGETAVCVRMQLIFNDSDGNEIDMNSERGKKIINSLTLENGSKFIKSDSKNTNNIDFKLNIEDGNYYYYYIESDGINKGRVKILYPGESTSRLFNSLSIPVLKSEYNSFFDSKFTVKIVAEGITVWINEDSTYKHEEISEAAERFKS